MKYFSKKFYKNGAEFIGIYRNEYRAEVDNLNKDHFYNHAALANYVISLQTWTLIKMRDPNEIVQALLKLE